jgi:nicotinate-nucleotide adenylyltransferase
VKSAKAARRRIGVFGGTFDPIHIGHLIVASEVRERFKLERVIFVPTARPPHKRYRLFASPEDRLGMVKLAVASDPHFAVSEIEQGRGYGYTVESLQRLKLNYRGARLYLIVGADNIGEIKHWREPEEIFRLARVVAVRRPDYDLSPGNDPLLSKLVLFRGPEIGISSTDVRRRIRTGKTFRHLVPEKVAEYILQRGLYS